MRHTIKKAFDAHCHVRQGEMLTLVVPETRRWCDAATIMPNTAPPIVSPHQVQQYAHQIRAAADPWFEPVMTIKVVPELTPTSIRVARDAGARAAKLYAGITTGSATGISDIETCFPIFEAIREAGMLLLVHGEVPDPDMPDRLRESAYLDTFATIVDTFPEMRIVLEHVSTTAACRMITEMPAIIGATITPHHLFITEQDADSNPHCLCKPKAKTEDDRLALIAAAISGDPKFFAGTDSAPHPREKKDFVPKSQEAFGCFTAPAALPLYAMIFEEGGALSGLENFVRNFGRSFYGLPEPSREPSTVTLVKEPWTVPAMIRNANYEVVPFMAGETLTWRIADKRDRS